MGTVALSAIDADPASGSALDGCRNPVLHVSTEHFSTKIWVLSVLRIGRRGLMQQCPGGRLGYANSVYVHDLRKRYPEFPKPVAELSAGLMWAWPDVEAWVRATGEAQVSDQPGTLE